MIGGNAWICKVYMENQGRINAKLRGTPQELADAVKVTISKEARELQKAANPGFAPAFVKLGDE